MGACLLKSGETAVWRDPGLGLAGDGGNVLKVGLVVQDGRAVVLCDGRGKEVDNACCPVMPAARSEHRKAAALPTVTQVAAARSTMSPAMTARTAGCRTLACADVSIK